MFVVILNYFKNLKVNRTHTHQTGGTFFVRRGGCHPVQRGGAVQIFFKRKNINKIYKSRIHIPKGRRHFCTERRVPPCAAGRGCADSFLAAQVVLLLRINGLKIESQAHSYSCIRTKREAPFLYGEEGATLCSGEGLCRCFAKEKIFKQNYKSRIHIYQKGGAIFVRRGGCHPVQRGGAVQFFYKRKNTNINANHTYTKREAAFFVWRGGCHPVQRGGAVQIFF